MELERDSVLVNESDGSFSVCVTKDNDTVQDIIVELVITSVMAQQDIGEFMCTCKHTYTRDHMYFTHHYVQVLSHSPQ